MGPRARFNCCCPGVVAVARVVAVQRRHAVCRDPVVSSLQPLKGLFLLFLLLLLLLLQKNIIFLLSRLIRIDLIWLNQWELASEDVSRKRGAGSVTSVAAGRHFILGLQLGFKLFWIDFYTFLKNELCWRHFHSWLGVEFNRIFSGFRPVLRV